MRRMARRMKRVVNTENISQYRATAKLRAFWIMQSLTIHESGTRLTETCLPTLRRLSTIRMRRISSRGGTQHVRIVIRELRWWHQAIRREARYTNIGARRSPPYFADPVLASEHVKNVYRDDYFFGGKDDYAYYLGEAPAIEKRGLTYAIRLRWSCEPSDMPKIGAAADFILKGFELAGLER